MNSAAFAKKLVKLIFVTFERILKPKFRFYMYDHLTLGFTNLVYRSLACFMAS